MPKMISDHATNRRHRQAAKLAAHGEHRAYNDSLDVIQTVLGQMPGAHSLDELLRRTIAALHRLLGNTATVVLELMPDGDALDTRVVECSRPLINPPILPITMGLIGSAARTGETVVVQDVR